MKQFQLWRWQSKSLKNTPTPSKNTRRKLFWLRKKLFSKGNEQNKKVDFFEDRVNIKRKKHNSFNKQLEQTLFHSTSDFVFAFIGPDQY